MLSLLITFLCSPSRQYINPHYLPLSPVFPLPDIPYCHLSLSKMDMYGSLSTPDFFSIDDLLDFSNHDLTTTSSSSSNDSQHHHLPPPQDPFDHQQSFPNPFLHNHPFLPTDSTVDLCVPGDDLAELEWLSQFVDDSFNDFPASNVLPASTLLLSDTSFPSKARSKRSKAPNLSSSLGPTTGKSRSKTEQYATSSVDGEGGIRRCTHCASEKTPQWRTGPMGPKTLCNACGVRYKSGRLVPEYRPAASPTFVLTQHSNSHRKVMELRRQKELLRQQELQRRQ